MIANLEIYRVAACIIDCYGENAVPFVLGRAERLRGRGDFEAAAIWFGLLVAIEQLQRAHRPSGTVD